MKRYSGSVLALAPLARAFELARCAVLLRQIAQTLRPLLSDDSRRAMRAASRETRAHLVDALFVLPQYR